jgi:hypothetical protein
MPNPIQRSYKRYNFVKEQRVDGSCCIKSKSKLMLLRCTLMGGQSRYQTNIPSKQIILPTRDFVLIKKQQKICQYLQNSYLDLPELLLVSGQKDSSNKLAPWLVTGFTDLLLCSLAHPGTAYAAAGYPQQQLEQLPAGVVGNPVVVLTRLRACVPTRYLLRNNCNHRGG